jgi:histidinol phosphatase-like enzyme (inositol monophosphatase family)
MTYQPELETIIRIARRAGEMALRHFEGTVEVEEKSDRSPVTIADRQCEQLISRLISEQFPADGIVGEEGASARSHSGRRWLIDPIDGTRDFVRGLPFWSIQIALQDHGQVVAGLIYLPCQNEVYHAALGSGCYCNDTRLRASRVSSLDKAVLTISGFKDAWSSWRPEHIRFLTQTCWTVRAYGGCHDVAMLARGKVDLWLSGNGMEWDYAPGVVIAQECGAKFLTRDGSVRIDAGHCVICAPGIEGLVRKALGIPEASQSNPDSDP